MTTARGTILTAWLWVSDHRRCQGYELLHPGTEPEHELATRPTFPMAGLIPPTNTSSPHVNIMLSEEKQYCFLPKADAHEACSSPPRGDMAVTQHVSMSPGKE